MARFTRSRRRKVKYKLSPKEAEQVIREEFTDYKGNKTKVIYDVTPQKWNAPTIEIENQSKYTGEQE